MVEVPQQRDDVAPESARTVLVTGASSGVGRATALLLARSGGNLVLVSRSLDALSAVAAECTAVGGRAVVAVADVADPDALASAFDLGEARWGKIDGVVHAAAVLAFGRFEDVPGHVFDRVLATNVIGTANVAREALRRFRTADAGTLVVVGSVLGRVSVPYMSGYVASKWAVHGLVRALQIELRGTPGIRVGLVTPGGVDTPIYRRAATYSSPLGAPPPPVSSAEEVAAAIVRALDDPSRNDSVGVANGLMSFGFRVLPAVFDRAVAPLMELAVVAGERAADSVGNVFEPRNDRETLHADSKSRGLLPAAGAMVVGAASAARRIVRGDGG